MTQPSPQPTLALPQLLAAGLLLLAGCSPAPDVVLYCALDQVHAEPILERFEKETGLHVRAEFDVEANKTVGLVTRLREERERPRCDVFWNNELAHTVALAEEGLFQAYAAPNAEGIPEDFRDPQRRWTGFAARGRVLIANTQLLDPDERAQLGSSFDLIDPRWASRAVMARPLTGTTLTHMAALFQVLGETGARDYLERVHSANQAGSLSLAAGNAAVMRLVRDGERAFGWTDTDDVQVALDDHYPVELIVPDQGAGQPGVLLIPNSLALLAQAPHPENGQRLINFLLDPAIERELAYSRSAQIPLHLGVERPANVLDPSQLRVMPVDWAKLGAELAVRQAELKRLFVQ